ncbi:MAG: hypothetical protein R2778_12640 [Saprospiraceae bacterium]
MQFHLLHTIYQLNEGALILGQLLKSTVVELSASAKKEPNPSKIKGANHEDQEYHRGRRK